jgi:site-specific DNA recombinase
MRVAIYYRVSTDRKADEGVSGEDQVASMKQWASAGGHEVVDTYEDASTARDDRRPSFLKMIDEATSAERPYDAILVHSQSRFFRDHVFFGIYERKLKKAHVDVVSITQPITKDNSGQMVRTILSVFDEYQSKENGKHVTRCMLANAEQGYYNGSTPPFGYETIETEKKARSGYKKSLR